MKFPEVILINNKIYKDNRGFFLEVHSGINHYTRAGDEFFQDNCSFSVCNSLRGIHLQLSPWKQAKLVQVLLGKILDVIVDLRKDSPTFGQWDSVELDINSQLYIPEDFGHAFLALEDSLVLYKCTHFYHKPAERTIRFNDPDLNINWPIKEPIISEKDKKGLTFKEIKQEL